MCCKYFTHCGALRFQLNSCSSPNWRVLGSKCIHTNTIAMEQLMAPKTMNKIPKRLFFPPNHEVVLKTMCFWPSNLYVLYL